MNAGLSRALILIVGLNLLPAPQLRPLWVTLIAGGLLVFRLWLEWTRRPMPPRALRLLTQAALGGLVWRHYGSILGDEASGALLTLLVVIKTFELNHQRDYFITFCMCLLTLMSYLLLDQSLLMTLFTAADVIVLTAFLFALGEGRLEWRGVRRSLAPSLSAAVKATPLVVIVFVLFPRFSTGFGQGGATQGKIGVTDSLRPGSVAGLVGSNELVFRATFLNGLVPPKATLYWRGAVLTESDGLNWDRPKTASRRPVPSAEGSPAIEIFLEPGFDKFLFTLDDAAYVTFPNDSSQRGVNQREGQTYEMVQPLRTRERYNLFAREVGGAADDPAAFLKVSRPPSDRMREFLSAHRGADVRATVHELLAVFRHDYSYTLEPPPARSLDAFVFGTKAGFCEHYAGALATMLRYQGIAARVVVGFQGGASSILDNYVSVRGNDAHAWVEYFNERTGRWLRVDPTAQVDPMRISVGAGVYQSRESGWLGDWTRAFARSRAVFDEVDAAWTGFLLRFDLARQKELLAAFGMEGVLFRALPVFLILAIALITAVMYFVETRRRGRLPRAERLWRLMLAILRSRWGVSAGATEPPLAFLARLRVEHPELADRVTPAFEAALRVRFAPHTLGPDGFARARAEVRRLKRLPRAADRNGVGAD